MRIFFCIRDKLCRVKTYYSEVMDGRSVWKMKTKSIYDDTTNELEWCEKFLAFREKKKFK